MSSAAFTRQFSYRFATPITGGAHESWTLVGTVDTSYEVTLDTDYALIVKIGNTGDMSATGDFQLQYNVDGAGWNNVNASSSNVRVAASGDADDATSATERVTTSARTFQTSSLDEGDGLNSLNLSGGNDIEFYFAINFRSAELSGGETVTFKVLSGGGDPDAIDIVPTSTIFTDPDTTVTQSATTALTLTENQATVANDSVITQSATTALTLAGIQATVSNDSVITQGAATALTLAENTATIVYDVDVIQSAATALTLTGNQATVTGPPLGSHWNSSYWNNNYWNSNYWSFLSSGTEVTQAATTALTLTTNQATVASDTVVTQGATTALTLTGNQATVAADVGVTQGATTALTLTGNQATVANDTVITQGATTALTLVGNQATIDLSGATNVVQSATTALTLTENQATIVYDVDVIQSAATALTLTGNQATVTVGIDVTQGSSTSLTLTANQATVAVDVVVTQSATTALTLTGNQATIDVSGTVVQSATTALTLATNAATITYDVDVIQGATTALTLTGNQATINTTINVGYWAVGYWNEDYWNTDYWADYVDPGGTGAVVNQTNAAQMSLTAYVTDVEITANILPVTAVMTLTPYATDTANDITVECTLPTLTLASINVTQDAGEYYEGDISFSVYTASAFDFTETANATLETLTLTAINPGVSGGTGDVIVSVTTTPTMTLTSFPVEASNTIDVRPITPGLTLTSYGVSTGFGTLANATLATMTLNPRQANVVGVNADINEFAATLATLSLTAYNPETIAFSGDDITGGHYLPDMVGVSGGKKRKYKKKGVREIVEDIVRKEVPSSVKRVSRKRKYSVIDQATQEVTKQKLLLDDAYLVDRTVAKMTNDVLAARNKVDYIEDEDELLAIMLMMMDEDLTPIAATLLED